MVGWKKALLAVDSFVESFCLLSMLTMVIIVSVQVVTRKLFNFVFFWSEEVTLLLLAWFAFMGIAIGCRENLHLSMDVIEGISSKKFIAILDKLIQASTFIFGVYLIIYGWEFTVLMGESTLPATKLPNSALYVVMPLTGVMTCAYSLLQFMGIDTKRHKNLGGGLE
ncbi:MAG TPA: TRAP transporter small permease [Negativicutes bacterium]|nr:TRAP transporter small permease [Negativicutes bacterium]